MNKKKLLFYINTLEFGGAERVMSNLCNQFAQHDYTVVLVNTYKSEYEYVINDEIKHIYLEDKDKCKGFLYRNIDRILKLRRICKTENPDLIISFMTEPNTRSILATLGTNTKTLISIRNDPKKIYSNKLTKLIARYVFPLANGCVFQNAESKKWFPISLQEKSEIIANQIEESFFETNDNVKMKLNTIVTVGRLEEQKNHAMLIKAFSQIRKEFDVNLEIWGMGSLEADLRELVNHLSLDNYIKFMGNSKNIKKEIEGCRLFVLSSNYEGMPNSLIEAMALGLPVISTDCPCGGPKELIDDGINGLLIDCNNVDELVKKIRKLLTDKQFSKEIGDNAKLSVDKYNPQMIFQEWENYILKVI